MASVEVEVAGRKYKVACRDGEEAHIHSAAVLVDQRARDAAAALGSLPESRLLLFTSLLLADDIKELRSSSSGDGAEEALADSAEALAERMEAVAQRLEERARAS